MLTMLLKMKSSEGVSSCQEIRVKGPIHLPFEAFPNPQRMNRALFFLSGEV
jgi:hypothetical protein